MAAQFTPEYLASLSPEYLAEDNSAPLLNLSIAFMVILTAFIVLFFISRSINHNANGIEFWFLMPMAYLFCMVHCVCGILLVKLGGAGRHIAAVVLEDPHQIVDLLKLYKVVEFAYITSVTFPKLAILALYMRIFTTGKSQTIAKVMSVCLILFWLSGVIASFVMCRPFAYNWDKTIQGGKCGDLMAGYRYISIPNIVSDFFILILPLPTLWKLQVDLGVKIGLFMTFVFGSLGIVGSIIRTNEFFTKDLFSDVTFYVVTTMSWTLLEPAIYFMAACMPALRPLKRKLLPNTSFSTGLSSLFTNGTNKSSQKNMSDKSGQIRRTRHIDLKSSKVGNIETSSMESTRALHADPNGYVELQEWQVKKPVR